MSKSQYSYIVSPVGYEGGEDRAFEPTTFASREEADDFINDMGSRWVLYPNIEIYRVMGDGKSFSKSDLQFVVGYNEFGEYGSKPRANKPRTKKPSTKRKSGKRSSSTPTSIRGMR